MHAYLRTESWSLSLGAEYYGSSPSLALATARQDAPGLVDFWRLSAAFRFDY